MRSLEKPWMLSRAGILIALVVLLAAQACGPMTTQFGYRPPFSPVAFNIDSRGNVSISGDRSFVTPLGLFAVGGSVRVETEDTSTILTIRVKTNEGLMDQVYRIESTSVVAVIDGRTVLTVENHRVFVDASSGTVRSIEVKPAEPPAPLFRQIPMCDHPRVRPVRHLPTSRKTF
jgi:hypothetical protein